MLERYSIKPRRLVIASDPRVEEPGGKQSRLPPLPTITGLLRRFASRNNDLAWSKTARVRTVIRAGRRRFVAFIRDEDGSPLVEFAILAPVVFLVVFAIIEWGQIFYIQSDMYVAARLAMRQVAFGAIADTSTTAVLDAACSSPSPIAGTGYTYTFTYKYRTGCPASGYPLTSASYGTVTLTITTPASSVLFFNYKGLIGSQNLTASVTMLEESVCLGAPVSSSQIGNKSC